MITQQNVPTRYQSQGNQFQQFPREQNVNADMKPREPYDIFMKVVITDKNIINIRIDIENTRPQNPGLKRKESQM